MTEITRALYLLYYISNSMLYFISQAVGSEPAEGWTENKGVDLKMLQN